MDRCATDPLSFGATFWNPGVKTEKTAKKRRKNEQKWARYGLTKRVRVADLFLMDRYEKAEARLRSAGKDGKSKAKGGSEAGSGGEEVQADGAPAPQSAMGNLVFETKTKVEQLEKALETLDRRRTLSRPGVSDDDEEEEREGDEALSGGRRGGGAKDVKALGARLSKLEKSVRSQATASMRE